MPAETTTTAAAVAVVTTTVGDEGQAEALARALVENRLAACVQYAPVRSVYRWKGAIEVENEYRLTAKTGSGRVAETVAALRRMHTYELPEIVVLPVTGGLDDYLQWVRRESAPEPGDAGCRA
jgi:periplasmic divalent cation tolerance protein